MAKKIVIIDSRDYDAILDNLTEAKSLVGAMAKSGRRERLMFVLDKITDRLTGPDDLEQRVSILETRDYWG